VSVINGTVHSDVCVFKGAEYRQICAYLKGQSTADVCVFKGAEYRQMCAYLKGQSTGRCVRI
jgi:hypothetical protein